jgi:hypothetical protein
VRASIDGMKPPNSRSKSRISIDAPIIFLIPRHRTYPLWGSVHGCSLKQSRRCHLLNPEMFRMDYAPNPTAFRGSWPLQKAHFFDKKGAFSKKQTDVILALISDAPVDKLTLC